jgi:hypothetical protein
MKRLVKLKQGWLELDIRTYRQFPLWRRRRRLPGGYSVMLTRYGSDGWSVGDPEFPVKYWMAGAGLKLSSVLAEFAGISPDEAETIVTETLDEWKRRDPDAPSA